MYVRLITLVDDFGRYDAHPRLLISHVFPMGDPSSKAVTTVAMDKMCKEVGDSGMVLFYENDGKRYLQMSRWQERARAEKSRYPAHDDSCSHLTTVDSKCSLPSPASPPIAIVMPPVLDCEEFGKAWGEYLQYRKERGLAKLADIGISKSYSKLAKWGLLKALQSIENTISNNWQGLFEPKDGGDKFKSRPKSSSCL